MDVEEGDAKKQVDIPMLEGQGGGRGRLIAIALTIQVFCAMCLAFSVYSLQTALSVSRKMMELKEGKDTGIFLEMVREVWHNEEKLQLRVGWKQQMELEDNNTIIFGCTGPYLVHLSVCFVDTHIQEKDDRNNGTLVLRQGNTEKMTIPLDPWNLCKNEIPQTDQRILSFATNDKVSIKFSSGRLKLKYLYVGFHYMLGQQCFYN
ncbi:hypothetical protein AGOR_G00149840 [Albula goreensis]|uniref:Uncharacterized protein n=1 Tax=Albula goreensis TaxID=1534307 RepID=A0A8T3DBU0_9TELE|nr:hypothetical protein AGOR_G00149840 [Albula goreensis]